MNLFYSPTSPYVRKVMVVLHETGQLADVTLKQVATTPVQPADGLLGKNPLTKVPALERPDGPTLFDSRVICAFLNARAQGGLVPQGEAEWQVRTLEALGDGILDAALLMTYERRIRPEPKQWDDWIAGQWGKIVRACAALESQWLSHLAGPFGMGQIAVACALAYVDFRHGTRDWRGANPGLAAWFEKIESRPSLAATKPPQG